MNLSKIFTSDIIGPRIRARAIRATLAIFESFISSDHVYSVLRYNASATDFDTRQLGQFFIYYCDKSVSIGAGIQAQRRVFVTKTLR